MNQEPVIKIKDLEKVFFKGKPNEQIVLGGINLDIYPGEYVIMFGPSGSGKSTLLNIIAGLDSSSSGEIIIRGEKLSHKNPDELAKYRREKIGVVFQKFNLIENITVLENVYLPYVFAGKNSKTRVSKAQDILHELGLIKFQHHKPSELSGGQQQKVAIARALINNPWILLVDEPTGNLDSKSAKEVMELFLELNKKSKRTIFLITHNEDYAHYPDRIIHLKDGIVEKVISKKKH